MNTTLFDPTEAYGRVLDISTALAPSGKLPVFYVKDVNGNHISLHFENVEQMTLVVQALNELILNYSQAIDAEMTDAEVLDLTTSAMKSVSA